MYVYIYIYIYVHTRIYTYMDDAAGELLACVAEQDQAAVALDLYIYVTISYVMYNIVCYVQYLVFYSISLQYRMLCYRCVCVYVCYVMLYSDIISLYHIIVYYIIRPFVILRIVRPIIFESKFRNHCAKKLVGALRKSTSFV